MSWGNVQGSNEKCDHSVLEVAATLTVCTFEMSSWCYFGFLDFLTWIRSSERSEKCLFNTSAILHTLWDSVYILVVSECHVCGPGERLQKCVYECESWAAGRTEGGLASWCGSQVSIWTQELGLLGVPCPVRGKPFVGCFFPFPVYLLLSWKNSNHKGSLHRIQPALNSPEFMYLLTVWLFSLRTSDKNKEKSYSFSPVPTCSLI